MDLASHPDKAQVSNFLNKERDQRVRKSYGDLGWGQISFVSYNITQRPVKLLPSHS